MRVGSLPLLRREGLYAAQLSDWRKLRESSGFGGMEAQPAGRKVKMDAEDCTIARLEKRSAQSSNRNWLWRAS